MSGSGESTVGYVGAGGAGSGDCRSLRVDKALEEPVPVFTVALTRATSLRSCSRERARRGSRRAQPQSGPLVRRLPVGSRTSRATYLA